MQVPINDSPNESVALSEIFMPKEYWVTAGQVKVCFACKNEFDFWSRKHHCRMCGNIFDSKCSNYFVSPPDFLFEDEKKIRLCGECYSKAQTYLDEPDAATPSNGLRKKGSRGNSLISYNVKEMEAGMQTLLTRKAYELTSDALEFLLKEDNLYDDWFHHLKSIVKECMEIIQPQIWHDDHLNINAFIKVKKVPYKDRSLTRFVRGLVIHKNVLNRKMSTNIPEPKVLMFKGNLDENSDDLSIVDSPSLHHERNYFEEVIKKILDINPQIIITAGRVGRLAQESFVQAGKTIINKMKESQFERVADLLNCSLIDSWSKLDIVGPKVLGKCNRFSVVNYQNKAFFEEDRQKFSQEAWDNFDPSLMFFEGCTSEKDATILLSGPSLQELRRVKACLKKVFLVVRSIFLERSIIVQEIGLFHPKDLVWEALANDGAHIDYGSEEDFRQKLKIENNWANKPKEINSSTCLLNESTTSSVGYMMRFLTERMSVKQAVERTKIRLTKFVLIPLEFDETPDLANSTSWEKMNFEEKLKNSMCWHRKELCEIEREPQQIESYFWDKEDVSIGTFLLGKVSRGFDKCAMCGNFSHNHITFFLVGNFYVKIESDPRGQVRLRMQETNKGQTTVPKLQSLSSGIFEFLGGINPFSKNKLGRESSSPGLQNLANSKSNVHHELIGMYIECSTCCNRLSEIIKLKRSFLEYSFSRFVESLVQSGEENVDYLINEYQTEADIKANNSQSSFMQESTPKRSTLKPCCPSGSKNRVFLIEDFSIKIRVGFSNPYTFDSINYQDAKAREFLTIAEESLILEKKAKLNEIQKSYLGLLIDNMKKVLNYLTDRSNLDLSLETINREESLAQNPSQGKDPYNMLLMDLVPLYQRILNLRQEIDKDLQKERAQHFDVDESRKEFYRKLFAITDFLERSKDEYLNLMHEVWGKPKKEPVKTDDSVDSNSTVNLSITSNQYDLDELNSKFGLNEEENVMKIVKGRQTMVGPPDGLETSVTERQDLEKELQLMGKLIAGTFTSYDNPPEQPEPLKFNQLPIYEDQVLSFIAYSLNSPQYMKEVYKEEGFWQYDQEGILDLLNKQDKAFKDFLDSKFLFGKPQETRTFLLKFPQFELEVKYLNHLLTTIPNKKGSPISPVKKRKGVNLDIIEDIVGLIDMGGKTLKDGVYYEKIVTPHYRVTCYYPTQFEALRIYNGIDLKEYIRSLSSSRTWDDNTGGKTGASFIKTNDQRFAFKEIKKKEFGMLLEFMEIYLKYIWTGCSSKQRSLLIKIYGVYEIHDEKKTRYFIAMENLLFGMGANLKVYDLKGSELNRFVQKREKEKNTTLLDTNYKIDRNGEPLVIKAQFHEFIEKAIVKDTEFLASQKKIDYSLLLIYDEQTSLLRMGIIDYLRSFDLEKQIEFVGKRIIKGAAPTIIGPDNYKERFQKAMKNYFVSVYPNS